MVDGLRDRVESGGVQLFCIDSVDSESWYNRDVPPRWRIARHVQYDNYIVYEVAPFIRQRNRNSNLVALGCSFGGFHAVNAALRHPDLFTGMLAMSGAFDLSNFLGGYHDEDVYFNQPTQYLPNMNDAWYLDRYRQNKYVLATGWDDQCLGQNQNMDRIMNEKGIPHQLFIWNTWNSHDWPTWQQMVREYL
jgi:esterase/lipase superfamily enzyme